MKSSGTILLYSTHPSGDICVARSAIESLSSVSRNAETTSVAKETTMEGAQNNRVQGETEKEDIAVLTKGPVVSDKAGQSETLRNIY